MKSSRPLLAAAAAAGLLAAGCDYWKNLVDGKSVTAVPLTIQVRDAFTRQLLPEVHCADTARGVDFITDTLGAYVEPEAGTGPYTLRCSTPNWYYDREVGFEVSGEGGIVVVELARRGGEAWYPEEPDKQVRVLHPPGHFRIPLNIRLSAYPTVDNGTFRYEWTFRNNEKLNQKFGRESAGKSFFNLSADSAKVGLGPDTLILTVKARLAGREEYWVGADTLPIEWTRNRLPVGTAWANDYSMKFGCRASDVKFLVFAEGSDPDPGGSCDSVVVDSRDPTSMFGIFHASVGCNEATTKGIPIALQNPFGGDEGGRLQRDYDLSVSFWDDNKTHRDTTLRVTAYSNILPTIRRGKIGEGSVVFTTEPVSYWIEAHDEDGPISYIEMNWGNGDQPRVDLDSSGHDFRGTATYTYYYPYEGNTVVTAYVRDNCETTGSYPDLNDSALILKEALHIRKNTDPVILVTRGLSYISRDSLVYNFKLSLTDKDVEDRVDGFKSIRIEWGDDSKEATSSPHGVPYYNTPKEHLFALPGPESGYYTMRIIVQDEHGGQADTTLQIPIPER